MFVLGRLSVRIVLPLAKLAAALPMLPTWTFHVQPVPRLTVPLTLFVFTAVRSAEFTFTVSLHELLLSLLSVTTPRGSTAQTPPVGLAYDPATLAVAVKLTSTTPVVAAIVTGSPLAMQLRMLLEIVQSIGPVTPDAPDVLGEP